MPSFTSEEDYEAYVAYQEDRADMERDDMLAEQEQLSTHKYKVGDKVYSTANKLETMIYSVRDRDRAYVIESPDGWEDSQYGPDRYWFADEEDLILIKDLFKGGE